MRSRLQTYGAYFLVIVLLLSLILCHGLGLGLLKSSLQMVSNSGYIFINTLSGGTSSRPLCAPKGEEINADWEPWPVPKHRSNVGCTLSLQIKWHCRHALFQQDDLNSQHFIFSQLSNHLHNSMMRPVYQPIHLGVIGMVCNLEQFTHLANNAAHEVYTMIT